MKVLKITTSEWVNSSRDKREFSVLQELGAEVLVMAKGNEGDNFKKDIVDGYNVLRFSTRPLGNITILNPINRFLSVFNWAYKAKKIKPDIISGHDLIPLLIGWLSNIGRRNKAKLVYDSHEFELKSLNHINKSRIHLGSIKLLEAFLMKRCAFCIMVNDSIADEVQKIHKLKVRPIVVRSTPSYWELNQNEIIRTREFLCNKLNVPKDTFLVMYHGVIDASRGIEPILEAISKTEGTAAIILGNGDENYINYLKNYCASLFIVDRCLFLNAVPINELYKFVGATNCGLMILRGIFSGKKVSYYYSLANKFFENIQSLTPIIFSNFPEYNRLISQYKIGLTVDPININELVAGINLLKDNKVFYAELENNLKKAKEDLCWENEKHVLENAYKALF